MWHTFLKKKLRMLRRQTFQKFLALRSLSWTPKSLSSSVFHHLADEALELIVERMDAGDIDIPNMDVTCSDGVVNLNLGIHGTWVINKQSPNRQIWLSSPKSGPARFDYDGKHWVSSRDASVRLEEVLENEISQVVNGQIKFNHSF
jgi:frataxin